MHGTRLTTGARCSPCFFLVCFVLIPGDHVFGMVRMPSFQVGLSALVCGKACHNQISRLCKNVTWFCKCELYCGLLCM